MSLAKQFNKIIKSRLLHYAAWSPVIDRYEVGDFGGFRRGVFQKLGNIREFGIDPGRRSGDSAAPFDFTSSGATIVRTSAGVAVDVFPEQAVEAKLEITFDGGSSFYVRTSALSVDEMSSVDSVARQLRGRRDPSGRRWRRGWRVVRKVYTADHPAILASLEKKAGFSLTGRADALKQLELGNASADITVTSTHADSMKIAGGRGPIAVDLFRVRLRGAVLEKIAPQGEDAEDVELEPELDEAWPDDPPDDPEDLFA